LPHRTLANATQVVHQVIEHPMTEFAKLFPVYGIQRSLVTGAGEVKGVCVHIGCLAHCVIETGV
jgi:hypothetical protein